MKSGLRDPVPPTKGSPQIRNQVGWNRGRILNSSRPYVCITGMGAGAFCIKKFRLHRAEAEALWQK